jgi:hypothetical protein
MTKKGREDVFHLIFAFYGFLITSSASTAPTTMMAMMTPMIAGMKYRSAADCGVAVGAGVAAVSVTTMLVTAVDPQ